MGKTCRKYFIFVSRQHEDTYRYVKEAVEATNRAALPDIQGSLRSYVLSASEKDQACRGLLDIISGFVVLDDDVRIIVLECIANRALSGTLSFLKRDSLNNASYTLLHNTAIQFPERLYTDFGCALKFIRVRNGMKALSHRPDLYDHGVVTVRCYDGVDKLIELLRVSDLLSAKKLDLFPSTESLESIELLFGEAVSLEDLEGKPSHQESVGENESKDAALISVESQKIGSSEFRQRALSDCRNSIFEKRLAERGIHRFDYLALNRTLRCAAVQRGRERLAERLKDAYETRSIQIRTTPLRQKNSEDKHWMTPSGFVYPKPRTLAERIRHPKKPSASRIDDLTRPYEEFTDDNPQRINEKLATKRREANFRLRLKAEDLFGMPEAPAFEYDFDPKFLGDRDRLPRGRMINGKVLNSDFYRSVHLMDAAKLAEVNEAKLSEAKLWRSKVVVDNLDFKT